MMIKKDGDTWILSTLKAQKKLKLKIDFFSIKIDFIYQN